MFAIYLLTLSQNCLAMVYFLTLSELPFVPEERQGKYVGNQHNLQAGAFMKEIELEESR